MFSSAACATLARGRGNGRGDPQRCPAVRTCARAGGVLEEEGRLAGRLRRSALPQRPLRGGCLPLLFAGLPCPASPVWVRGVTPGGR